jgi:hypothetical protein
MERSSFFKASWISQTAHLAFDEELPRSREDIYAWLKKASYDGNGERILFREHVL